MGVKHLLQSHLDPFHHGASPLARAVRVCAIALGVAAVSIGATNAAARVHRLAAAYSLPGLAAITSGPPARFTVTTRLVWEGADLDGDGQSDIANPTGHAPRGTDAYGEGRFHATRDGGDREHEGVDYVASPGQKVAAPISGYVARIGFAYPDDQTLRFVEIDNPALKLTARVFYVNPAVAVGDAVAVGRPIGQAHSLQHRYPNGITDHIHLELTERGRKVDAASLIVARNVEDRVSVATE